jgi:hypothetical protein
MESVDFQQTTAHLTPEDGIHRNHRCENLKFKVLKTDDGKCSDKSKLEDLSSIKGYSVASFNASMRS